MADLTRRGFLAQTSVITGLGIVGGLGLRQLLAPSDRSGAPSLQASGAASTSMGQTAPAPILTGPQDLGNIALAGPMVVHVRDVASGEVALMVGPQELIYRDAELVSRLVQSAAAARIAEA